MNTSEMGYYQVAGHNGHMYYRYVSPNNTTEYADEHLACFYSEEEAKEYIDENYGHYNEEFWTWKFGLSTF